MTASLTTSAPVASMRARARVEVGGHAVEVVMREHDAPAAGRARSRSAQPRRHSTSTYSAPSASASLRMRAALLFGAVEVTALPRRPAGDDHRHAGGRPARRPRSDRARVSRRSSTRSASATCVAPRTQLGHGGGRHGHAELRSGGINRKNASSTVRLKRRLVESSRGVLVYARPVGLFCMGTNTTTTRRAHRLPGTARERAHGVGAETDGSRAHVNVER